MKKLRLTDLCCGGNGHILQNAMSGKYLTQGGLSFKKRGQRTHDLNCTCPSCDGNGSHVHADDSEVFILLQGKARMEINGNSYDMVTGDVIICEPGEDHHLVSDMNDPCVNLWLHAGDSRPAQQEAT